MKLIWLENSTFINFIDFSLWCVNAMDPCHVLTHRIWWISGGRQGIFSADLLPCHRKLKLKHMLIANRSKKEPDTRHVSSVLNIGPGWPYEAKTFHWKSPTKSNKKFSCFDFVLEDGETGLASSTVSHTKMISINSPDDVIESAPRVGTDRVRE